MTSITPPRRKRTKRVIATSILAVLALLAMPLTPTAFADVQSGSSVWIGGHDGYPGAGILPIYDGAPADPSNPGTPDFWAYCIEHNIPAQLEKTALLGDLSSYLGSNYFTDPAVQGKVLWILAHSYPAMSLADFGTDVGVPTISRNDAIEATQYAIWRYTELTFDAAWDFSSPDSGTAYWYLVNGANASSGMTPQDFAVTASVSAPGTPQVAGSLVGPFVVHTNQSMVSATVSPGAALVDSAGNAVDPNAVVDGQELYLDLRGATTAGSATVTVAANGSSATGDVISVPDGDATTATADSHAQSLILVAANTTKTTAAATAAWSALAVPAIGTTLVDAADRDHSLVWNGGTLTDTVAYQNLTPGTQYTVSGELMKKSDGTGTGITGSMTFTPTAADGSVDVSFTVPQGYAGQVLVAFEELFEGASATGTPVAVHNDIDSAAQTVTVDQAPVAAAPAAAAPAASAAVAHGQLAATGGELPIGYGVAGILAVIAGLVLFGVRRRIHE
jgi:TQXA domain-containing protein